MNVLGKSSLLSLSVNLIAICLIGCGHGNDDKGVAALHGIAGSTVNEVCENWADYHFEREKVKQIPPYSFVNYEKHSDSSLVVECMVDYSSWGYSKLLRIEKEGGLWLLKGEDDNMRWHKRPSEPDSAIK